jgi:glycosyltransferase involved in cell wall biosynthesis
MNVCMVTPHMPPEQAANALLPSVLARELLRSGDRTTFLTHPAAGAPRADRGAITYVAKRGRGIVARSPIGAAAAAARMGLAATRAFRHADLVHLHSNGFIVEVAAWVAARRSLPYVITLYGTDVWHFDPTRHARFATVVREAAQRVFYSRALRDCAIDLGLANATSPVVYAPVDHVFQMRSSEEREATRKQLGVDGPMLLTVKRLHPVAGHEDLLRAFAFLVPRIPRIRLCLAGDGELRSDLERLARDLGVAGQVQFLGRVDNRELPRYYAAADLFVLPSRLESWGTVMLEALACGTRVVATDTAGATEARGYFELDLVLADRESPDALAAVIERELHAPRRVGSETLQQIESMFRPASCTQAYRAIYEAARRP